MAMSNEEKIARLTRERDEAFAEWARVSSLSYCVPLWKAWPVWFGGTIVLTGFYMLSGASFWPVLAVAAGVSAICVVVGWYAG